MLFSFSFWVSTMAQEVSVSIDGIVANDRIFGTVRGLQDHARFKIVVYVKTDRWYVHPYADAGEGKSWARISRDGGWTIGTVQREFPATAIAAIVVAADFREPSVSENVRNIPHVGIYSTTLLNTADYGKL